LNKSSVEVYVLASARVKAAAVRRNATTPRAAAVKKRKTLPKNEDLQFEK
jgi:hypothetical protein